MPFILVLSVVLTSIVTEGLSCASSKHGSRSCSGSTDVRYTCHVSQVFCNGRVKWMHTCSMVRDRVLSMFVAVVSHEASSCVLQCRTGRSQFTCSLELTEEVKYITLSWYKIRYDIIQYLFPAKWCNKKG
jgi:hypothetical protein